jgi:hypothetical protein
MTDDKLKLLAILARMQLTESSAITIAKRRFCETVPGHVGDHEMAVHVQTVTSHETYKVTCLTCLVTSVVSPLLSCTVITAAQIDTEMRDNVKHVEFVSSAIEAVESVLGASR